MNSTDGLEFDLDGHIDEKGVKYIGKAIRKDGQWRCLAQVDDALCVVEIKILDAAGVPIPDAWVVRPERMAQYEEALRMARRAVHIAGGPYEGTREQQAECDRMLEIIDEILGPE
jgi:hypothetical protein